MLPLFDVWERYVVKGLRDQQIIEKINPRILSSWERCLAGKLSRENVADNRVGVQEIKAKRQRHKRVIEIANPFIANLYEFVKGSGFVVLLLDQEACTLELIGDPDVLESHSHFRVGEFWDEESKGTNAMGIVKIEEKPVQVFAAEHFMRINHQLTCSAAPIRAENGEMLAILDVSGNYRRAHAHTLGMVVAAAQAIENQVRLESADAEIIKSYNNIDAILQSMSEGVISFDEHGRITRVNPVAAKFLQLNNQKGSLLSDYFKIPKIIERLLKEHRVVQDKEVFFDHEQGREYYLLSGQPIFDERQRVCGGVIILKERKEVHRLVTKIVGANAQFIFEDIIGKSEAVFKTIQIAKDIANSMSSVNLQGESGTGKEMFAQAIHNASPVAKGPFVAINCAAIPRDLIESELFGYEEGAFTGAKRGGRPGKFELANDGTIFLDEVGDMPLEVQASVLRLLQDKKVIRIGGFKPIQVNIRVIAATNKDLKEQVKNRSFREDLYYRLNVISITVPPLRNRKGDVLFLANYFIEKFSNILHFPVTQLDPLATGAIENYFWPGNVRELSNAMERAVNLAKGKTITLEYLPEPLQNLRLGVQRQVENSLTIEETERKLIVDILEKTGGNISHSAALLGIGRNTLYRKIRQYEVSI